MHSHILPRSIFRVCDMACSHNIFKRAVSFTAPQLKNGGEGSSDSPSEAADMKQMKVLQESS